MSKNPEDQFKNWTALHWAAFKGEKDIVMELIDKGANVNAKDINGWTPLFCAIVGKVKRLGMFVNRKTRKIYREYVNLIELLIENGANVNATTKDGTTLLVFAILMGEPKMARLIEHHGGKKSVPMKE